MTATLAQRRSYREYLEAEAVSTVKHEYLRGQVYAMAGGTLEHGRLAVRFSVALSRALAGRPCDIYSSDVRVRVQATELVTYPDLSVVCGKALTAPDDPDTLLNP